jgi:hypothetical protein
LGKETENGFGNLGKGVGKMEGLDGESDWKYGGKRGFAKRGIVGEDGGELGR